MWRQFLCAVLAVPLGLAFIITATPSAAATTATSIPKPDHIVIVVEENRSPAQIVGSPAAPFITSLANQNANFTNSFAEVHPSQPNYLALFSGSTQGVTNDSCPHSFATPDLASDVMDAGMSFVGYSEDLPSPGYTGCTSGEYARKHNPWVDFPAVPASANQPFSAFPTDYSTLPTVSFVIPNLLNDMHDGTIAQGDAWLQQNMSGYISWAQTHNSLFVLTFDENNGSPGNQIPTVVAGQNVIPGNYAETINHYNVLRTLTSALGVSAPGTAASAAPVTDVWSQPANDTSPSAAFGSSCTQSTCSFDGSGSSDPDGTIASYTWDFGDSGSGNGVSPSHTYQTSGTYTVRLTVADNQGATDSITHTVTVTAPAGTPFVSDPFNRTVTSGWGRADIGGPYILNGVSANFSVTPGAGTIRMTTPGAVLRAYLPNATSTDADVVTTVTLDKVPVGGPVYSYLIGRRIDATNDYDARIAINTNGVVQIWLARTVAGTKTSLTPVTAVPNLTYTAGTALTIRLQVTGTNPTTIRARLWPAGTTEPTTWNVSTTDTTTALQNPGAVGFSTYLASATTNQPITATLTNLTAKPTATQP